MTDTQPTGRKGENCIDRRHEAQASTEAALTMFPKLDIRDGAIHYKLYRQDGTFQKMCADDTLDNRFAVEWMQQHDRYTVHGEETNAR